MGIQNHQCKQEDTLQENKQEENASTVLWPSEGVVSCQIA